MNKNYRKERKENTRKGYAKNLCEFFASFSVRKLHKAIRMTFELVKQKSAIKAELYANLQTQLRSLLEGENDFIANAANFSARLYHSLADLNWVGF